MKNGHKRGKQLYKCKGCDRQFVGGVRLNPQAIESDYIDGKQTLSQLAVKYGVCQKTIWNSLESMHHKWVISKYKDVVVEMDATYWGRSFGMVIIKDSIRNKVLWYKFIRRHERVEDYVEGIGWLREHGFKIFGAVCDGLKGLFEALRPIPVQMCQFHMVAIVKRYLTSKPDIEAAQELLSLTKTLSSTSKQDFLTALECWHIRYEDVLKEKRKGADGSSHYVRPRLRAAYLSIKRHSPWLWTFEKYKDRVIPNTNAGIESLNARLKTALRVHSGIKAVRRQKLLENFIASHY